MSAEKKLPEEVVLGTSELDGFDDVAQPVGGSHGFAVLYDPMQLVLRRTGLLEGACRSCIAVNRSERSTNISGPCST